MAVFDKIVEAARDSKALDTCLRIYTMATSYKQIEAIKHYRAAQTYAKYVFWGLDSFERHVRGLYDYTLDPECHELIVISEAIRTALCEEAGGMPPEEFIKAWVDQCAGGGTWVYTTQQHEAAKKVAERWADKAKINNEFWFLALNIYGTAYHRGPASTVWEVAEPMQDWLGISPPKLYAKKMNKGAMRAKIREDQLLKDNWLGGEPVKKYIDATLVPVDCPHNQELNDCKHHFAELYFNHAVFKTDATVSAASQAAFLPSVAIVLRTLACAANPMLIENIWKRNGVGIAGWLVAFLLGMLPFYIQWKQARYPHDFTIRTHTVAVLGNLALIVADAVFRYLGSIWKLEKVLHHLSVAEIIFIALYGLCQTVVAFRKLRAKIRDTYLVSSPYEIANLLLKGEPNGPFMWRDVPSEYQDWARDQLAAEQNKRMREEWMWLRPRSARAAALRQRRRSATPQSE